MKCVRLCFLPLSFSRDSGSIQSQRVRLGNGSPVLSNHDRPIVEALPGLIGRVLEAALRGDPIVPALPVRARATAGAAPAGATLALEALAIPAAAGMAPIGAARQGTAIPDRALETPGMIAGKAATTAARGPIPDIPTTGRIVMTVVP